MGGTSNVNSLMLPSALTVNHSKVDGERTLE